MATTYLPPRRLFVPEADITSLFNKTCPVYLLGDLNARHQQFGHSSINERGRLFINLVNRNICRFLGPDFNTLISGTGKGKPDILMGNRQANLYMRFTEGQLTSSDHLPVKLEISTKPILYKVEKRWDLKKANWELIGEQLEEKNRQHYRYTHEYTRIQRSAMLLNLK